jgi:hypothetical protein
MCHKIYIDTVLFIFLSIPYSMYRVVCAHKYFSVTAYIVSSLLLCYSFSSLALVPLMSVLC